MKTDILGRFAVYPAQGVWIVKNRQTGQEVAHEPHKAAAIKVARIFDKHGK